MKFTVVVDSNALFPKDPTKLVSGKFLAVWDECAKLAILRFLIPEIVRGERLYRLLCVAQDSLANAVKNFDSLAKVSGSAMPPLPAIATVKAEIEKRFDDWAKSKAVEIVLVPYDKINWPRVAHDAVWRNGPFTPAGAGEDSEKGFRDCLILETLAGVVSEAAAQVIFISGDRLLRESAIARFDSNLFAAYENLEGFHSYLTVTRTQMVEAEKQTAQKIIQAAPKVFYAPDNPKCVYTSFNIYQCIMQQHAAALSGLDRPQMTDAHREVTFEAMSGEKIVIDSTQFEPNVSKAKTWGWKTRIKMARLFRKRTVFKQETPIVETEKITELLEDWKKSSEEWHEAFKLNQVVRVAPFDVFWTAICDKDANFTRLKLVCINPLPHVEEMGFFKFRYGFTDEETTPQSSNS